MLVATPFTVRHFILECSDLAQVRNNCFHVDNMKQLFQDIHIFFFALFYTYNALYIVSLHYYDRLWFYSVQSNNMYSRLE